MSSGLSYQAQLYVSRFFRLGSVSLGDRHTVGTQEVSNKRAEAQEQLPQQPKAAFYCSLAEIHEQTLSTVSSTYCAHWELPDSVVLQHE